MTYELRRAEPSDIAEMAEIWHSGWIDGHLDHVDQRLIDARAPTSFVERTRRHLDRTAVASTVAVSLDHDRVAGFVMVIDDEVEQLYVAVDHRSTQCAALLLNAAETQIARAGNAVAWLAVVAGNARARRFYEKLGWKDRGPFIYEAAGEDGTDHRIPVEVHRYETGVMRASSDSQ